MSDGIAKNWYVVKGECRAYWEFSRSEIRRICSMDAPATKKLHHLSGLLPDAPRMMPRTLSYTALPVLALIVLGVWVAAKHT